MSRPIKRPKVGHSYDPFPFERPATSRHNNKNFASPNEPATSHHNPASESSPKTPHNGLKPTLPTSSSHKVPRPTGAYPGQFAPLTKRTSLPPPGEMTQHAEENLRAAETREARRVAERKAEKMAKKEEKKAKKERQKAEDMKGKDAEKDGKGGGEAEGQSKNRGGGKGPEKKVAAAVEEKRKKAKPKKPKTPGLIQVLEMQSRVAGYEVSKTGELTYIPFTSRFVSTKVQRSRQQRQQESGAPKTTERETPETGRKTLRSEEKKRRSIFPFLNLPETAKIRIYKLLVVETKLCIWPATKAGREQPDVSMVCKEIRKAVLAIYYGENTFAFDIAPPIASTVVKKTGSAPAREPLMGLAAVQRWAEVLSAKQNENGKWFVLVKNLCFSYRDPVRGSGGRATVPGTLEGNRDFIVNVQIMPKRNSAVDDGEAGGVSKTARAGPVVEIHREAACIMPGWSDCGRCVVQTTPEVLVLAIRNWLRSDRTASEGLKEFVLEMWKMIDGLSAACCTKTPNDGEHQGALP